MCKQELSFKTTSSNLKKHLERPHPTVTLSDSRFCKTSSQSQSSEVMRGDAEVEPGTSAAREQPKVSAEEASTSQEDQKLLIQPQASTSRREHPPPCPPVQGSVHSFIQKKWAKTHEEK